MIPPWPRPYRRPRLAGDVIVVIGAVAGIWLVILAVAGWL